MKTIINFCPTGMIPTKAMNSDVPVSVSEIIEQTHEAYGLGITMAHLHARDINEKPTYKAEVYQKIMEGVRNYCPNLIICLSTSGRDFPEFEKRSEVIELRPDLCSLTLSSLNFPKNATVNTPKMIEALLDKMIEYGVYPELESFDLGMINFGKYLLKKKNITEQCYWNLIFGNISGMQPTFNQIGTAINEIPHGHHVAFGGIGSFQLKSNAMAISAGYGVRVGLEDNLWYDEKKTTPATNLGLLKRIHALMEINGRKLMRSNDLGMYNKNNEKATIH